LLAVQQPASTLNNCQADFLAYRENQLRSAKVTLVHCQDRLAFGVQAVGLQCRQEVGPPDGTANSNSERGFNNA